MKDKKTNKEINILKEKIKELEKLKTECKNSEEKLRKTQERLELAMDAGEHGFWDWNLDTNDVYFSPRYYTMLGYEPGELPMRKETWADLMHPEDRKTVLPEVENYVKNSQPYEIEFRLKTKSGNWKWISGRGKSYKKDINGIPHRAVGIHIDITDRKKAEEELWKSYKQWETTFDTMNDSVLLLDMNGKILKCNYSAKCLLGKSYNEIIGNHCWQLIHGKSSPIEGCPIIRMKKTLKRESMQLSLGNKLFEVSVDPMLDSTKKLFGAIHTISDITKRKQAEEALKESEEKYRFISENTSSLITVTTSDLIPKNIYISPSHKNILGYSPEELIGKKAMDVIHPEDKKKLLKLLIKYIGIKVRQNFKKENLLEGLTAEYRVKDKKGNWHYLESIINHYENKIILVSNDITERKQAEKELEKHRDHLEESVKKRTFTLEEKTKEIKESQQALSLLLEDVNESRAELETKTNELNISLKNIEDEKDKIDAILKSIVDGLIVTDLDNKIILMNHIAENLLNIRLIEVLNKPLLSIIKDKNLRKKFDITVSKVKEKYKFDFELLAKNAKHPNIYNAETSVIKDKKDKIIGIITTFHDVTQEHKIDQMKTDFISTAAHELRTPLTAIQGFSEILNIRDDLDDEKRKRFLYYINSQAINLGNIVNDMLDISRIESGIGFSLKLEKCKINEEILRTCSAYELSYPNYLFYVYLPDKELEVFIDSGKIEQVMENLLNNAVKYSSQGSKISIKGKISGNEYIVSVEDEGIGINPKDLSRVFENFFRSDYSNTSIKGTGLGMSIVKHIIEAHKGKVWLESKLGKGTKVHFSIPMRLKKMIKRRSKIIENE